MSRYDKNNFVFIDENGINTDLARIYGRAAGGERCNDKVPLNTPQNTTILSSVRYNGETAYTVYQCGTSDKFVDYLKNVLTPTLQEGDIAIMELHRLVCPKYFHLHQVLFLLKYQKVCLITV